MEQETIRLICKRGKELFVARSLLIQSSRYFAALFSKESNWLESSIGTIELDSWRRDDLATILQSLTTKETEAIFKNVNYYFAAINYFSIYPLMEQCIELKIRNITDESVIADLEFAERFSVVSLRDQCIEYLLRRLPDLLRGSRRSRRKMSAELLEKLLRHENLGVRNEDEVLLLIDAWCSWGERKSERSKFLQYVRFAHLTENAFEKCRQDAQCLQVSRFRRLLETPRWSDLNEEFLSGRKTSRVHYHILGFLSTNDDAEEEKLREYDEFADEPVLHCSEAGTLSTGSVSIEGASPTTKTPYKPSIVFGTAYYDYHIPAYSVYLSTGERVQLFSGFAYHPDSRDLNMSHPVTLREYLYIVAAPVYFKDYLFVVHMPFKNEPTLQHGRNILEPEVCDYLQVYRFYGEKACFRTFRINIESHPRELRICQCLGSGINCFFVDDQWMILCLPNQDVLLVLHPVRRTIELAEQCLLMKNSHRLRTKSCSEMVVIGNVAYVLINFSFFDSIEPQSGEPPFNHGETLAGSITAYDLTEGQWLPGHFVDLTPYFAEKMTFGSIEGEDFSLFLKVVQDELFLIIVSSRVEPRQSGFPLASVDYVYRLERSDDRLWLSPVTDSAAAAARVNKWLERDKLTLFTWSGNPEYVDVHPCKYASMLQLKASQENDPNERNKLRRFIW